MTRSLLLAALALSLTGCATARMASDRPITGAELREHIAVLASDRFEGRKPGAASSALTTDYIVQQWARAGLQPGAQGGWLQGVPLVDRAPGVARVSFNGQRTVTFAPSDIIAVGADPSNRLDGLALVEARPGSPVPADIAGKVAVLRIPAAPAAGYSLRQHRDALTRAGAAAIVLLAPGEAAWAQARRQTGQFSTSLASRAAGIELIAEAGAFDRLRAQAGAGARLSATITMDVRRYDSPNVIGRIPGTGNTGEAIAIIGHWDHLGICRPEGAIDRVCNGAVDNASGIAVMIEVAERLARGPKPTRDILFIATTAEESGLLGARHYVANPTVPLPKLVAVLNIDTIAIGPRGLPVSAVNRGNTGIDPLIDAAVRAQGRALDADLDANAFIQRQDGAAFTEAGVPAVMAGGSFADMALLQRFLGTTYHGPEDELTDAVPLGGAAEDADLHVILARMLADPARYPTPKRP